MNRQTFFRVLAGQCLRMGNPAASFWRILNDPEEDPPSPSSVDALYREAMRLGIDPARMERQQLQEMIAGNEDDAAREE